MSYLYQAARLRLPTNIAEYVRSRTAHQNAGYSRKNGKGFYYLDGKTIPEEEFHQLYPLVLKRDNYKGENPNGRLI